MKRPSWEDDYVRRRAVEIYKPRLLGLFGKSSSYALTNMLDIAADAIRPGRTGFAIAQQIDGRGLFYTWDADDLVGILRDCSDDCVQAIKELTAQWVRLDQIKPAFAVGAKVKILRDCPDPVTGEITEVREEEAVYCVHTPEQKPGWSRIIEFENVEAV